MERKLGFEVRCASIMLKRAAENCPELQLTASLTGTHGYVLAYLANHTEQDVFQRDLERAFSIRRSTVTQILQLMEKNGLITRESVPQDARLKRIRMTEQGRALHQATVCAFRRINSRALAGVSEEEQAVFFGVLDKIKSNLSAQECAQSTSGGLCPSEEDS